VSRLFAALVLALASTGCYSTVSAPASSSTTATSELWYVKERHFLFVRVDADVYYCPAAQSSSHPKVCTRAALHED